ncbi:MAG: NAD(P)H-quinone oxidoreductase [Propionibacteriaceae bacterium]|nr:NAD(P)H-quinone oxidoreductase [Propionibacteriaceae bacterium]
MFAITVDAPGGAEVLHFTEVVDPEPHPGEVRIAVHAAGVNRADILQRKGFYPPPQGITDILGLEVAGVIESTAGDSRWKVGDEVVALLAGGGYGEFAVVPDGQCAPLPQGLSMIEAAAIMEIAATVVSNFNHIRLCPGETILIHGGAGGIGSFAIPYAKHLGLTVITTVGNPTKADHARNLGADAAIDYHEDWESQVRDVAPAGVDAIVDIMGAKYLEAHVNLLTRGGRMVVIGLQGGTKGTLDLNKLLGKSGTITATSLRFRPVEEKAAIVTEVVQDIWPLFEAGTIPLPTITTFPLADARLAHERLESGENVGKIVLVNSAL